MHFSNDFEAQGNGQQEPGNSKDDIMETVYVQKWNDDSSKSEVRYAKEIN